MSGLIALAGSGEYLPVMQVVDRFLLDSLHLQGRAPHVVCLATAAGQEGEASVERWSSMGLAHFTGLGAQASAPPVIDRASAEDPQWEPLLASADLIYFSGGNPLYLFETLHASRAWQALEQAWQRGAVLAGCSAGAMILGKEIPNFRSAGLNTVRAFGLLPVRMVFPHFDRWRAWRGAMLAVLRRRLKAGEAALGIDEETALVGRPGQPWAVMGRQTVSLITREAMHVYQTGELIENL